MNDEIKEILDRIETASEIFDCLLKPEECTELLDYITNLQQEIEKLNEDKRGMLVELYKLNDTKDKIQDEYEKIIFEYLAENCGEFEDEHMEYLVDLKVQQYINLQQENETRQEDINNLTYQLAKMKEEKEDYKYRCEKASEKLGNYKHYSTPTEEQNSENEDIVDSALNILQNERNKGRQE